MACFEIQWKASAKRELKKLEPVVIKRIIEAAETLRDMPYPQGVKKIQGAEHTYRIRVGQYRVVYSVEANILLIEIIKVGHRKEVYQNLS